MKHLVFLLEEPSAKDLLAGLLPKILPKGLEVVYLVFEGKQDLEAQLGRKMRGWLRPGSAFIVLRDQDAALCSDVKTRLAELVAATGRSPALVRVACRELESWIVGDWQAVGEAFDAPALAAQSMKEAYRNPDLLVRPVEALRKFVPAYQKRDGARRVGPLLDPGRNQSPSFRAFCTGLQKLAVAHLDD
jgi:hypothetical protein